MTHRRGPRRGVAPRRPRRPRGVRVARRIVRSLWFVAVAGLMSVAALMALAVLLFVGFFLLIRTPMLATVIAGGVLFTTSRHLRRRWRGRRLGAAGAAPLPHHPPPPPRRDLAWTGARTRFAALRAAYAAHECDPMAVLRLPALSDVKVPSTARFVDAFAEAQALETDDFPPESHAAAFVHAVERAERAWKAAGDAAERIRLSNLGPDERRAVERVIKLLTTARDSDNDAERLAAYARARTELARLDRAGVIHVPQPAQAVLEVAGRGQLPA